MNGAAREAEPLRLLVVDEGVLGHRTLKRQLTASLEALPGVEARMVTVPPPSRLGRLWLRRAPRLGDADLQGLRWRLRWSWQARRLLARNARWADVALLVTQASALLCKGPMRRLPVVLSVDATVGQFTALEYQGPRDRHSARQQRLIARLERRAIAGAAAVVAWTEWNAAALREEYGEQARLETIHPGLDVAWWGAAADARPDAREGPLRVLFVGNDVERKGLGTLVEAVARLEGEAVLEVVSGDEIPNRDFIEVHRGISANSEELRATYAAADVLALPTRADAVPWAVLEGMAAGLPVVASDVGAVGELLGGCGELVPPGDADALAAALRRLAADPERRRRLGAAGRERVAARYDSAVQTPRLVELLAEVAGPAGATGRLRMRRRTFVALGAGAAGVAVAAPYAALVVGEEFEQLVASRLGIEPELAAQLLRRAREEYGEAEYDARAAAFALAVRDPVAIAMPEDVRQRAIDSLLEPMLSPPAANLAYAITGADPGGAAPCSGLVREP